MTVEQSDTAQLRKVDALPSGWVGFVMKTVGKEPWQTLFTHAEHDPIRVRGMTAEEAIDKGKARIPTRPTKQ